MKITRYPIPEIIRMLGAMSAYADERKDYDITTRIALRQAYAFVIEMLEGERDEQLAIAFARLERTGSINPEAQP